MSQTRGRAAAAAAIAAISTLGLVACARSGPGESRPVPPARMEQTGKTRSVVLTPLGLLRIGIKTVPSATNGKAVIIPFGALLYEPDGRAAVYVQTAPRTYTRQFITVSDITAGQVFVSRGLTAGQQVVTVGAEELLGVQNGVGVQT